MSDDHNINNNNNNDNRNVLDDSSDDDGEAHQQHDESSASSSYNNDIQGVLNNQDNHNDNHNDNIVNNHNNNNDNNDNEDEDEDEDNDFPFYEAYDAMLEIIQRTEHEAEDDEQLDDGGDEEEEEDNNDNDNDFSSAADQYPLSSNRSNNNVPTILPRPRDHSYLQGSSHPLLGPNDPTTFTFSSSAELGNSDHTHNTTMRRKRCSSSSTPNNNNNDSNDDDDNNNILDLAILELNGVVLFPGSTIPVKLRDRSLIQYLGRQIDLCRNVPHLHNQVRLGILTYQNELHQRQRETERLNSRRYNSTDTSDDDDDDDDDDDSGNETNNDTQQQRRRQRRRIFANGRRWFQRRRRRQRQQQQLQQQQQQQDDGEEEEGEGNQVDQPSLSSAASRPTRPQHRFIGRIGTIATIQYTHERTLDDDNDDDGGEISRTSFSQRSLWGRYEQGTELVFTAVGTSRFRVVGCKQQGSDMIDYRVFQVEELIDQPLTLPPILRRPGPLFSSLPPQLSAPTTRKAAMPLTSSSLSASSEEGGEGGVGIGVKRQNQLTWNLSLVTPVPYFVYQQYWPWKILESLVEKLKASDGKSNLPTLDLESSIEQQHLLKEPMKFSFWMASNLPLSENERLDLLEMHSTYERLKLIENHVNELTKYDSYICCKQCSAKFTNVTNVFTVGGAEAATSNYVNLQGYIHQITTLREVDDRYLFFDGYPSTENSYFPGYSWTITYCRRCTSLLGWKFLRVNRRPKKQKESPDSPNMFYGFMSSNVKTMSISEV